MQVNPSSRSEDTVEDYVGRALSASLGIMDMSAQLGIRDERISEVLESSIISAKKRLMAMAILMDQAGISIVMENATWIESEPVAISKGECV
ncbi:MAG: hypothetical protein M0P69_03645 [Bacteroidales bacterium]|nr:hypothetical protein [Bacteroidales bacterium]